MFTIQPERAEHGPAIDQLLDHSFGPDRNGRAVYRLRDGISPIAGLCHVAVADGALVASLRFWPVAISGSTAVLLGPLAVEPALQGRGIGQALVRHGLARAIDLGYGLSVLVGSPDYYRRFGFVAAVPLGLTLPGPVEPERFQVRELWPGSLALARGPVSRHEEPERLSA